MIISYRHRFIFVHIYKTAGNSIRKALEPHAYKPGSLRPSNWSTWLTTPPRLILRQPPPKHIGAADLRDLLPPGLFEDFFTFAFVRNPWSWQVSLYHYLLKHREEPGNAFVTDFRDFDEYIRWRADHAVCQSTFLCDREGKVIVDFVGKVENIGEDFATICRRIGIRTALGHFNRSDHGDYRTCYTPETRDLVGRIYEEDICRFGYSF